MALIKKIELDSGVTTNYHRVVSVNNITNLQTIIEVASYTSKEKRLEEQNAIQNGEPMNVFIETDFYDTEYDKDMNVDNAYDYLKTLEKFANAKDDD